MKKLISLLIAFALLFALAGCGTGQQAEGGDTTPTEQPGQTNNDVPADETEEVTLKWVGAGWLANEKADTLIERWENDNPDVKVEYMELSNAADEEYLKNLDIMIASDEQIDLTYLTITDFACKSHQWCGSSN